MPEPYVAKNQIPAEIRMKRGANWFIWLAVLSMIDSILMLVWTIKFRILSLAATSIIDGLAWSSAINSRDYSIGYIGFAVSLSVVGFFIMLGIFARRGKGWSFILGMILYGLDALLLLFPRFDILGLGFHIYVFYKLFNGYKALREGHQPVPTQQSPAQPYQHQPENVSAR